eukprot:3338750-Rhodomonas_salina.1
MIPPSLLPSPSPCSGGPWQPLQPAALHCLPGAHLGRFHFSSRPLSFLSAVPPSCTRKGPPARAQQHHLVDRAQ